MPSPPTFLDDPRDLIAELDDAWATADRAERAEAVEASAVEWRLASGPMLRRHPLGGQVEPDEYSRWKASTARWLPDAAAKRREGGGQRDLDYSSDQVWHGLDADGRIVLMRTPHLTFLIDHQVDADGRARFDVLDARFVDSTELQENESIFRGVSDDAGRLVRTLQRLRQSDTTYHVLERFEYGDDNRCVRSVAQRFEVMDAIPHFMKDKSPEELRKTYRSIAGDEIAGALVEYQPRRRWYEYAYDADGSLIRVTEFDGRDGRERKDVPFERTAPRPLAEVVDDFAAAMTKLIVKACKAGHSGKPFSGLSLIYSCEHPHCGLPHRVGVCPTDAPPADPLDWEAYPDSVEFALKRPQQKLLGELQDQLDVAFGIDDFEEQNAAVVALMQRIAAGVRDGLSGHRHLTPDAIITGIDDHGDVDPFVVGPKASSRKR